MKRIVIVLAGLFAAFHASADLAVALGSGETVDTEAVTNVAFSAGNSSVINMRMLLNAQWNNNAEVIFGCDADNDGEQTRFPAANACDLASCNMAKVICRGNVSPDLNMRYPASQHGLRVLLR